VAPQRLADSVPDPMRLGRQHSAADSCRRSVGWRGTYRDWALASDAGDDVLKRDLALELAEAAMRVEQFASW